jgi:hypothetical protein
MVEVGGEAENLQTLGRRQRRPSVMAMIVSNGTSIGGGSVAAADERYEYLVGMFSPNAQIHCWYFIWSRPSLPYHKKSNGAGKEE